MPCIAACLRPKELRVYNIVNPQCGVHLQLGMKVRPSGLGPHTFFWPGVDWAAASH